MLSRVPTRRDVPLRFICFSMGRPSVAQRYKVDSERLSYSSAVARLAFPLRDLACYERFTYRSSLAGARGVPVAHKPTYLISKSKPPSILQRRRTLLSLVLWSGCRLTNPFQLTRYQSTRLAV
jgi:hypothetical protein